MTLSHTSMSLVVSLHHSIITVQLCNANVIQFFMEGDSGLKFDKIKFCLLKLKIDLEDVLNSRSCNNW